MTDKCMQMTDILKSNKDKCPSGYKLYLKSEITDKWMVNIFKGLKLPIVYDEIIGFFDTSIMLNCKSGILFVENGCYISRSFDSTYYVEYTEISSYAINKNLKISLSDGKTVEITGVNDKGVKFIRDVLIAVDNYCKGVNRYSVNKSGPVKELKDLISKEEYEKSMKIIHASAAACGLIGGVDITKVSDAVIITPIQITMLIKLGQVFNVELTKSAARSFIFSYGGAITGRAISRLTIGSIPGLGTVFNTITGAGLTEAIGWMFLREYTTNKKVNIKANLNKAVQEFQDKINRLSPDQHQRLAKDMEFISHQKKALSREEVNDVFFEIIAKYTFATQVDVSDVLIEYAKYLKNTLRTSERSIQEGTSAKRYYDKFQEMWFDPKTVNFDQLSEFVELFLGLYNSIRTDGRKDSISNFSFDIEHENPTNFFRLLYEDKNKRDENIHEKYMVHALTSLIYGYAADQEGDD